MPQDPSSRLHLVALCRLRRFSSASAPGKFVWQAIGTDVDDDWCILHGAAWMVWFLGSQGTQASSGGYRNLQEGPNSATHGVLGKVCKEATSPLLDHPLRRVSERPQKSGLGDFRHTFDQILCLRSDSGRAQPSLGWVRPHLDGCDETCEPHFRAPSATSGGTRREPIRARSRPVLMSTELGPTLANMAQIPPASGRFRATPARCRQIMTWTRPQGFTRSKVCAPIGCSTSETLHPNPWPSPPTQRPAVGGMVERAPGMGAHHLCRRGRGPISPRPSAFAAFVESYEMSEAGGGATPCRRWSRADTSFDLYGVVLGHSVLLAFTHGSVLTLLGVCPRRQVGSQDDAARGREGGISERHPRTLVGERGFSRHGDRSGRGCWMRPPSLQYGVLQPSELPSHTHTQTCWQPTFPAVRGRRSFGAPIGRGHADHLLHHRAHDLLHEVLLAVLEGVRSRIVCRCVAQGSRAPSRAHAPGPRRSVAPMSFDLNGQRLGVPPPARHARPLAPVVLASKRAALARPLRGEAVQKSNPLTTSSGRTGSASPPLPPLRRKSSTRRRLRAVAGRSSPLVPWLESTGWATTWRSRSTRSSRRPPE